MTEFVNDPAAELGASVADAIDRLSTLRSDVRFLGQLFDVKAAPVDELEQFVLAVSHVVAGTPMAKQWPDGSAVGSPLTARQVLYLVELAGQRSPLLQEELAARYGTAVNVHCTYCGAQPDEWCQTKSGRIAWDPHADRRRPLRSV